MSSKSLSSAAKASASSVSAAASVLSKSGTSVSSQAGSAASKASASLTSGAAKASSYADNLAKDVPTKSAGIFSSTFILTVLAIALGAAYYAGYLDGLIAYFNQMMGQAQDQKEQVLQKKTGHRSFQSAASDAMSEGTARTEEMVDSLHAKAQQQETGQAQNIKLDGPATFISDATKM